MSSHSDHWDDGFNRLSPFYIGLTASAGAAVTYGMVRVLASSSSMLVLIGVWHCFLAIGLEPAVSWFANRGLRRWLATTLVFAVFIAAMGGLRGCRDRPARPASRGLHSPGTALPSSSSGPLLGPRQAQ